MWSTVFWYCPSSSFRPSHSIRRFASFLPSGMITTEKRPGGIAVIRLAKEPVNSMDTKFWYTLRQHIDDVEKDPSCRALLLLSDLKKNVFTAGNDLNELYAPKSSPYLSLLSFCCNDLLSFYLGRTGRASG